MSKTSGRQRGFGLTEILIAMALFSSAFLYLLSAMTLSNHAIKHASDRVYAADLAERLMEQQRSKTYATISSYQGQASVSYQQNGASVVLDFTYSVDANVVTVPTTSRSLKNVVVQVNWVNRYMPTQRAQNRSVVMETAVSP